MLRLRARGIHAAWADSLAPGSLGNAEGRLVRIDMYLVSWLGMRMDIFIDICGKMCTLCEPDYIFRCSCMHPLRGILESEA